MALQWLDDFSTYGIGGQANMLNGAYAEITAGGSTPVLAADPDPTGTGTAVWYCPAPGSTVVIPTGYGNLQTLRKALSVEKTTIGGSVRIWMTALPASNGAAPFIRLADSGNTANVILAISTIGQVLAYRGDMYSNAPSGRTLLGSSVGAVVANAWNHIEWKVAFSGSVGTVQIWVNGVSVLSLTGQNTLLSGTGCANISVGCGNYLTGSWPATYYRDLVIWDTTGTYNNDVIGPKFLGRFTVDGDVSFNWTASTGTTGYNLINEAGPNDANYISAASTLPAASLFSIQNLPANAVSVKGIMLFGRMKKSDGGDCNVQMSLNDGTSDSSGANRPITTAYTYWSDIIEVNATTGVPWTIIQFNAARFKINRTT